MMNRFAVVITILLIILAADRSVAGFRYLTDDAGFFADDSLKQPPDTSCCDDTIRITQGEILIPRLENDSLSMMHTYSFKHRWPTGALFRSLIIPGWGQVYNHHYFKALFYGGTELYLIHYVRWRWRQMDKAQWNFQHTDDNTYKAEQFRIYEKRRDSRNLHMWLTGLVTLLSMFDAYVDAHFADFDQTDKSFQVYLAPEDDKIRLTLAFNFK
jgi:hypothetical protein